MKQLHIFFHELHSFLILWITQALSTLGSSMTSFALIIWSYQQQGSALNTALLSVCSYVPYIMMSIFAGALSDRWDKKATMLASDSFAAMCTIITLFLLQTGRLEDLAPVLPERPVWPYEYHTTAGGGCYSQPADSQKALPKGKRDALVF